MTKEEKAIKKFIRGRNELIALAHQQFTYDNCPLNIKIEDTAHPGFPLDHPALNKQLFDTGLYSYKCGFCRTVEQD
jgi:hypothetical protein